MNNDFEPFGFPVKHLEHRCIMLIESRSETSVLNASDYTTVLSAANSYTMFFTYQWIRQVFHWGCAANSFVFLFFFTLKTYSQISVPPNVSPSLTIIITLFSQFHLPAVRPPPDLLLTPCFSSPPDIFLVMNSVRDVDTVRCPVHLKNHTDHLRHSSVRYQHWINRLLLLWGAAECTSSPCDRLPSQGSGCVRP